jgi:hypothetical protein
MTSSQTGSATERSERTPKPAGAGCLIVSLANFDCDGAIRQAAVQLVLPPAAMAGLGWTQASWEGAMTRSGLPLLA